MLLQPKLEIHLNFLKSNLMKFLSERLRVIPLKLGEFDSKPLLKEFCSPFFVSQEPATLFTFSPFFF